MVLGTGASWLTQVGADRASFREGVNTGTKPRTSGREVDRARAGAPRAAVDRVGWFVGGGGKSYEGN